MTYPNWGRRRVGKLIDYCKENKIPFLMTGTQNVPNRFNTDRNLYHTYLIGQSIELEVKMDGTAEYLIYSTLEPWRYGNSGSQRGTLEIIKEWRNALMIYQCQHCGETMDEEQINLITTSVEAQAGVAHLYKDRTVITLKQCPYCGSDELEIVEPVDEQEEE